MAGYNKGIVDTRKLNEKNKASLGRGGDTKIREVGGRRSHVNALEAYLIDVNGKAGEEYAKRVGAGTINPLTGMPEYHDDETTYPEGHIHIGGGEVLGKGERPDYDYLEGLNKYQLANYLGQTFGVEGMLDKMQYMEGFQEEPFGFLEEQQKLTTSRAGEEKRFTERGLQSAYGATMGALSSREQSLELQREGLGLKTRGFDIQEEGLTAQQATLGRTTGRGYAQATGAAATAVSRSGLATSGTITQGLETQNKQLFQDYTAGTQDIGRQRAGIQIGREGVDIAGRGLDIAMGDIERQRGTALETLTLGKDVAVDDYLYTTAGADLDFRTSEYEEKKRQLDELYADVAAIPD